MFEGEWVGREGEGEREREIGGGVEREGWLFEREREGGGVGRERERADWTKAHLGKNGVAPFNTDEVKHR